MITITLPEWIFWGFILYWCIGLYMAWCSIKIAQDIKKIQKIYIEVKKRLEVLNGKNDG